MKRVKKSDKSDIIQLPIGSLLLGVALALFTGIIVYFWQQNVIQDMEITYNNILANSNDQCRGILRAKHNSVPAEMPSNLQSNAIDPGFLVQ